MALPDFLKFEHGTAIIFGESGAVGVTNTMALNALASAAGRMGPAVDLGADWDQDYVVQLILETGTAPAAGVTAELYLASCYDNASWPGKVTGSDAAYPATVSANKLQLGPPVTTLIATADTNTIIRQQPVLWTPPARYVAPVLINLLGQALRNEGTPSNNDSRIILVPVRTLVQDTA